MVLVSSSDDATIRQWNISKHETLTTLTGHTNVISSLAVLNNGTLVSGSFDQTIRTWLQDPAYLEMLEKEIEINEHVDIDSDSD